MSTRHADEKTKNSRHGETSARLGLVRSRWRKEAMIGKQVLFTRRVVEVTPDPLPTEVEAMLAELRRPAWDAVDPGQSLPVTFSSNPRRSRKSDEAPPNHSRR